MTYEMVAAACCCCCISPSNVRSPSGAKNVTKNQINFDDIEFIRFREILFDFHTMTPEQFVSRTKIQLNAFRTPNAVAMNFRSAGEFQMNFSFDFQL